MSHKRSRASYEADLPANETAFVSFGTPLPPADDHLRDDGSYVPIHKQEVRDDQGRRRLHGAFTGGWSAGYYNTVGSKEGWTPTAFVSSRKARHKDNPGVQPQRPEDFMDDEDHEAAADAEKIELSDTFTTRTAGSDGSLGKGLAGLICPRDAPLGINLLKRMGWKEGQGVGLRVRRPARLHDTQAPGKSEVNAKHLFAPDDIPVVSVVRKVNSDGVGYQSTSSRISREPTPPRSLAKLEDEVDNDIFTIAGADRLRTGGKSDRPMSGRGGIGIGVLNDTGSDEDDVYQMAPRISFTTSLAGTKKKKKRQPSSAVSANPKLGSKPAFKSNRATPRQRDGRLCRDGSSPLPGFVLARAIGSCESFDTSSAYEAHTVPPGWTSSRRGVGTMRAISDGALSTTQNATTHDPRSRALALGEAPLPGKSVFDFLSTAARERLVMASGRTNLPPAGGEVPPGRNSKANRGPDARPQVPVLDRETAIVALNRGKGTKGPYADDEAKQSRYRTYLEHAAGFREDYPPRPESSSGEDFARELEEFHGCAQLFKPMTGLMATRFTTSTTLHAPPAAKDTFESRTLTAELEIPRPQDPAEQAARLGMYGQVTRSEHEFYPTRLLCKRFNVHPPEHAPLNTASTKTPSDPTRPGASDSAFERSSARSVESSASAAHFDTLGNVVSTAPTSRSLTKGKSVVGVATQKPSEDVFRAIFGEDSDDE